MVNTPPPHHSVGNPLGAVLINLKFLFTNNKIPDYWSGRIFFLLEVCDDVAVCVSRLHAPSLMFQKYARSATLPNNRNWIPDIVCVVVLS